MWYIFYFIWNLWSVKLGFVIIRCLIDRWFGSRRVIKWLGLSNKGLLVVCFIQTWPWLLDGFISQIGILESKSKNGIFWNFIKIQISGKNSALPSLIMDNFSTRILEFFFHDLPKRVKIWSFSWLPIVYGSDVQLVSWEDDLGNYSLENTDRGDKLRKP